MFWILKILNVTQTRSLKKLNSKNSIYWKKLIYQFFRMYIHLPEYRYYYSKLWGYYFSGCFNLIKQIQSELGFIILKVHNLQILFTCP